MYPTKIDCQNAVLIKLYDNENEHQIRSFWTQKPEMFLKTYTFMQEHGIDIDIDYDDNNINDPYLDKVGTIKDIIFSTGGACTFNIIKVYLEVKDYR